MFYVARRCSSRVEHLHYTKLQSIPNNVRLAIYDVQRLYNQTAMLKQQRRRCSTQGVHTSPAQNAQEAPASSIDSETQQTFEKLYSDAPQQDRFTAFMQFYYRTKHTELAPVAFDVVIKERPDLISGRNQLQSVVFWSRLLSNMSSAKVAESLYDQMRNSLLAAKMDEEQQIECTEGMIRMMHLAARTSPDADRIRAQFDPLMRSIAERVDTLGLTDLHAMQQSLSKNPGTDAYQLDAEAEDNENRGERRKQALFGSAVHRVEAAWPRDTLSAKSNQFSNTSTLGQHAAASMQQHDAEKDLFVPEWPNPATPNNEQSWRHSILQEDYPEWAASTYHYFLCKSVKLRQTVIDRLSASQSSQAEVLRQREEVENHIAAAAVIAAKDIIDAWWADFFATGNPLALSAVVDIAALWTMFDEEYGLTHVLEAGSLQNQLPEEMQENPSLAVRFIGAAYAFRSLAAHVQFQSLVYEGLEAMMSRLQQVQAEQHAASEKDPSSPPFPPEFERVVYFLLKYRQLFLERRLTGLRWACAHVLDSALKSPELIPPALHNEPSKLGELMEQSLHTAKFVQKLVGGERQMFTVESLLHTPAGLKTPLSIGVRAASEIPPFTQKLFEANLDAQNPV